MNTNNRVKNLFTSLEYAPLKLLNKHQKVNSILKLRDGKISFDPLWPVSVELHLTNQCNLNCYWCTDKDLKKNKTFLDVKIIERLFREFKEHDVGVTLEGGGEPTLHKDFSGLVKYAGDIGLDIGLISNGTKDISDLVNYFKWIRVSIDAANPDEYKYEKNVDYFNGVMTNIQKINAARKDSETLLGVGYVITKNNDKHLLDFIESLDKIGIDYIYMRPVEEYVESLPDFEKLYKLHKYLIKNEDRFRIKVSLKLDERVVKSNAGLPCIAHSLTCIIRADGNVVMCEKRRHDTKILGNLSESSFEDIWLSEIRKDVSKQLLNPKSQIGCGVCRITNFNQIFYDLGKLKTINFI